jgi:hypothetical protein
MRASSGSQRNLGAQNSDFAFASHTSHTETSNFSWNKSTLGSLFSVKMALNQNATEGNQMLVALEINFAGWGMIICAAMEIAPYFDAF